jgi:NADPH2:quinone reductase
LLIRVRAIGLNFADLFVREGVYPNTPKTPFVPGLEISGVVESAGSSASRFALGQRVIAVPIFGGHAEKVVCPAVRASPVPEHVNLAEAAAVPVAFLTASYAIARAQIQPGDRVLVTAAAGGVGTALLQLLARSGAITLALVGSEKKIVLCRELGATEAGLYAEAGGLAAKYGGRVDVVIDAIGGSFFRSLWKLLDLGGRYVLYGFAAASGKTGLRRLRALREAASMRLLFPFGFVQSCRTLIGFNLSLLPREVSSLRSAMELVWDDWDKARIRPVLGPRFEFEALPEAHRALSGRQTTGKVLIDVSPDL